ncbi:MAG: hypothetical protein Q8K10_05930, partial [Methylobacter sp.]|nr:hypothetical protein [Methylobacter sp.]
DPPDNILFTLPKVFNDVVAGDFFQGALIKAVQPLIWDKAENQVAHQFGGGIKKFIAAVVAQAGD